MIEAKTLRNKDNLKKIDAKPGYYKWWAHESELKIILAKLGLKFDAVEKAIEKKKDLYCIYVGITRSSLRMRLNWHVNDEHSLKRVANGRLSTLRKTISSIVANNQSAKKATNDFIDKLQVEYFYEDKERVKEIENKLINSKLRVLNIQDNHHPLAGESVKALKARRKEGLKAALKK
jgi:hypothetical protein